MAAGELHSAVVAAVEASGKAWQAIPVICIGTTMADNGEQLADQLGKHLKQLLPPGPEVVVQSSAAVALSSGTGGPLVGCVLMAGLETSKAFGTMADRRSAAASGWGPVFMDGGCAYDLGVRALGAVSRAHDGRGADTLLVNAIKQQLGAQQAEDLIRWARNHASIPERVSGVASLAGVVLDCAARGDPVCDAILKHAVGELMRSAKAVAVKLGLDRARQPFSLVLAGSMLVEGTLYTQYLLEVLKEGLPTADIVYPRCDQAEAAAWLACWLLNPQQHIARR